MFLLFCFDRGPDVFLHKLFLNKTYINLYNLFVGKNLIVTDLKKNGMSPLPLDKLKES